MDSDADPHAFMTVTPNSLQLALLSAAILGFRHGFDYDHIAAITDITSVQNESVARHAAWTALRAWARCDGCRPRQRCHRISTLIAPRHRPPRRATGGTDVADPRRLRSRIAFHRKVRAAQPLSPHGLSRTLAALEDEKLLARPRYPPPRRTRPGITARSRCS